MPSSEPQLDSAQRARLIEVARWAIDYGLRHARAPTLDPGDHHPALRRPGASFVTLRHHSQLRGCIGHLQAHQALVADVADNAYAAAFHDPRFRPLERDDWPAVTLSLSILGAPEPMRFRDEADLIAQLCPGRDGLILEDGPYRGTFLPSVWDSLPTPASFLRELKRKAGLNLDHWSDSLTVARYRTLSFGESVAPRE